MELETIQLLKKRMESKKQRHENEVERMNRIREESVFAYKLKNDFDKILEYLREDNVRYVDIQVEEKDINRFIKEINSDKRYKDFKITHLGNGVYRVILLYT